MSFIQEIAEQNGVDDEHFVVQYLIRKTKAAKRGSKARRSLGNLYALYVIAEDYIEGRTSRFTDLLSRMRELPFGTKLQNHPLDNRLNDEFERQYGVTGNLLPVKATTVGGQKARTISEELLQHGGADPNAVAQFIVQSIDRYIELITTKQTNVIDQIEAIDSIEALREVVKESISLRSDARLFEIVSYVLLAEHFRNQSIFIGTSQDDVKPQQLKLYRTGRTNANDGGIDFVLQPLGRFFQVSETLDFRKYFLDFEKVNRFPFSFVIKIDADASDVRLRIRNDTERSGLYAEEQAERYLALIDEIFTSRDLLRIVDSLEDDCLERVKRNLILQFKLEFGLLD